MATVTVWGGSVKQSLLFGFCLDSMEVSFFSPSAMRTRRPSSAMCTIFLELDTLEAISVSFLEPTERNFLELRRTADLDLTPEDVTGLDPGAGDEVV